MRLVTPWPVSIAARTRVASPPLWRLLLPLRQHLLPLRQHLLQLPGRFEEAKEGALVREILLSHLDEASVLVRLQDGLLGIIRKIKRKEKRCASSWCRFPPPVILARFHMHLLS